MTSYQTESPYQYMPPPQAPDRDRIKTSMRVHGWDRAFPAIRDEQGNTIDGHTRTAIWAELGRDPRDIPTIIREGLTEQQKRDLVWMANVPRRHLTTDQKRDLIRVRLKDRPELSNRSIASDVGADHHTVGTIRDDLEASGEIPQTTRPHVRTDQGSADVPLDAMELVGRVQNAADHRSLCWVEVTFGYGVENGQERQHGALPYEKSDRREWFSERLTLTTPTPMTREDDRATVTDIAERLYRQFRAKPLVHRESV